MTRSIRARVTLLASVVVLVVLSFTAFALVTSQRAVLTDNVDEVLESHAAAIESGIESGSLSPELPGQGDDESFALVLDAAGDAIASTANPPTVEVPDPGETSANYLETDNPDGLPYRVMARESGDLVIVTGTPLDDVHESVDALARNLAVAVPTATALLAVLVWLIVARVLAPVESIRAEVADITGRNLHRRVPEPGTGDEISGLAHTMNDMLARLEESSERQRRFVADASHELRSPLTRIRAQLEVDLAHPATADLEATHRSVLEESATLEKLVDDLLALASNDGISPLTREPVDLDDLVLEEARRHSSRPIEIDVSEVSGAQVLGDREALARVIRNLIDNVVRHGGQTAGISVREVGPDAVVEVSDDGPGIPEGARERIFDRFARLDEARSAGSWGAGLGLAISRAVLAAHGGTIEVDPGYSEGARFVIRLPLP